MRRLPAAPVAAASATFHFIDVGEGQCSLIDWGDIGILIDGGELAAVLREYLDFTHIVEPPIEHVVATRGDVDAYGGLAAVVDRKALPVPGRGYQALSWLDPYKARTREPLAVTRIRAPGGLRPARNDEAHPAAFGSQLHAAFLASIRAQPEIALKHPFSRFHPPAWMHGRPAWFSLPHIPGVGLCVLKDRENRTGVGAWHVAEGRSKTGARGRPADCGARARTPASCP